MGWFFAFFVLSGFCGLVYQVVWLRIAMASFGVTTPLVSIVLSVFMAGLAGGSYFGGKLALKLEGRGPAVFLRIYAAVELAIGLSGIAVAPLLGWGRAALSTAGGASWGSGGYYLASAAWVTGAMLPFCICMGATFPLAMGGIREAFRDASSRSFSFLYVANVLGAMAGALGSAFVLIELLGFHRTLLVATAVNATVSALALTASFSLRRAAAPAAGSRAASGSVGPATAPFGLGLAYLFTTGLVSLALEVVWTRQFVPFQGPMVYSFATILSVYLAATLIGSRVYRSRAAAARAGGGGFPWLLAGVLTGASGLIALLAADPHVPLPRGFYAGGLRVLFGIGPFCGVLGFFTPMLVDRISGGDPKRAGTAYAVNTLGCILGPLLAGFALLPYLGERFTTLVLVVPLLAFAAAGSSAPRPATRWRLVVVGLVAVALVTLTRDIETTYPDRVVRRDHTATVIAMGKGMDRQLLVNGMGITNLSPVTKMMAHLPLAFLPRPPEKGLVLCLGMGTSYRSMLSWRIPTTVVELVPSIPALLGYFQDDGETIRRDPLGRIVVDDARRFLERSAETFDVIVIDPPPPVSAAASSLLYSTEFYDVARRRLAPDGILQQWLPEGEKIVISSVARALSERFAYVRVFQSIQGWGFHFLASARPLPARNARELAARLPETAVKDILEWGPGRFPDEQFQAVLAREIPLRTVIDADPSASALTDDRPVNEYYFLRDLLLPDEQTRTYH